MKFINIDFFPLRNAYQRLVKKKKKKVNIVSCFNRKESVFFFFFFRTRPLAKYSYLQLKTTRLLQKKHIAKCLKE